MSSKPITHIKKDDPVMLKQQIMYLKSELVQYEQKVKDYQNNYHYSMIEELKRENEELRAEIEMVKKEYEQRLQEAIEEMKAIENYNPERQQLEEENERLKKQIEEFNENGATFIKDLLAEKEEYMEKWETLKSDLHKVIQEQAQNQLQESEKEDHSGFSWFTNNLNSLKKK